MEEKRIITSAVTEAFKKHLRTEDKSENTVEKYFRDVTLLRDFASGREIKKHIVVEFKNSLPQRYGIASANSMLGGINSFLRFVGWEECCVRQYKVQRKTFCSSCKELNKAEYLRLVNAAMQKGNERLALMIQTLCGTGMRVGELQYITVEAVKRGEAVVSSKNKTRTVFIVRDLQKKLLKYAKTRGLKTGAVFVTKSGKPVNRCNIWRGMKHLCESAGVSAEKVFPHNLRHLFARTFYGLEKDIAKLADILGHSRIDTTRIYIITSGEEHKRKMENMRLII